MRRTDLLFTVVGVAILLASGGGVLAQQASSPHTFVTKWGSSGTGDGQFDQAVGVATDSSDNVYVVDSGNVRIQKFAPPEADSDDDGVPDSIDNCPDVANANQTDTDGQGDACDTRDDTTAPRVSDATPTGKGISRSTNVAATFSEAMDAATIDRTTSKLSKAASTNTVGAALTYDAATHKALLDPNKRPAVGTRYKAVVTTGALYLAGNALDQDPTTAGSQQKTWMFVTKR